MGIPGTKSYRVPPMISDEAHVVAPLTTASDKGCDEKAPKATPEKSSIAEDIRQEILPTPENESVLARILHYQEGRSEIKGKESKCRTFEQALQEICNGQKKTHWIWYVWPTLRGSRQTTMPHLELPDFLCARQYLRHPVLRERLLRITTAASGQLRRGVAPETLFGAQHAYDAPKFHECATVFVMSAKEENDREALAVMEQALGAISKGKPNPVILKLLGRGPV